jgi:Zn finger protein HypA/HybF involved in hydrogenase expression
MHIKQILLLQKILERTKRGRTVSSECSSVSEGALSMGDFKLGSFTECLNCQIVLPNDNFSDGCPNCGSKDFQSAMESGKKLIKK